MILDQLFEEKKKLNEIDPRNYDSDEDYYNDLHGDEGDDEEDFDVPDDDAANDMANDEESYYEKSLRSRGLGESRQRRLNEAVLMEDPVYRNFKRVGQYIAERKMSEKEILQVFADAEAGMTNKGTGANRTMLGRGKDTTMDFVGGVKDAVSSVLNSIQNSVPVAAVDVAYDQATDALANVAGGQKGKVMQAIKGYRNLVKQYPKTAGFAKAALVAIAGLATGGAGLPAIAGLTYALDSAIKGDKLSSVIGKGAGASAVTWGGQQVAGMLGNQPGADPTAFDPSQMPAYDDDGNLMPGFHINPEDGSPYYDPSKPNDVGGADTTGSDPSQMPAYDDDGNLMPGFHINPETGEAYYDPSKPDEVAGLTTDAGPAPGGDTFGGGTYTIQKGDQLGYIAQANGVSVEDIRGINPQIDFSKPLQPGTEIQLPVAGTPGQGSVWQGYQGNMYGDKAPVQENWLPAVRLLKLSADKLIDQKSTVMSWALNESIGVKRNSFNLTTVGTYTVFENVDRYRKAIMEKAGVPGSTRPAFYRPDMPGGPGKQSKPGLIGRGLNWLDKKAGQVGGALSNFGHQFTTGVTKEKLKMNWHQAGKPSDSDQLAAWMVKQGVPQDVVTGVYGKMGIPYTATATAEPAKAQAAEPQAATAGGAQRSMPFYGTNPATKKPWTYDELQAKSQAGATPAPTAEPAATTPAATAATTAKTGVPGYNYDSVMKMPGMEKYAKKPAPAKPVSFAGGPTGYGKTTMSVKPMTGIPGMKAPTAPAAPSAPKAPGSNFSVNLPAGGGAGVKAAQPGQLSKDEYIKRIGAPAMPESRVFNALKKPVAEMLQMVETKEDVQRIKQFIDQTFVKYGAVTESAFSVRNRLIEHVTQVGAQRRREFARKG